MDDILDRLSVGDRRTTGAANSVAREIVDDPRLFDHVFKGLYATDAGLRMRAADALEKASASNPALLASHTHELLHAIGRIDQQEVQWHVAQMLPRCDLSAAQRREAMTLMEDYFNTAKSNIVRVFSLQAMHDIADQDASLLPTFKKYTQEALKATAHSLRARAHRLLVS